MTPEERRAMWFMFGWTIADIAHKLGPVIGAWL